MKKFLSMVALATLLPLGVAAADAGPGEVIKSTAEEVMAIVKSDKDIQKGDRSKIFALVDAKVLPHFDFTRMTRLAMGRNWQQASADQQKTLVTGFRDLLVRTYSVSLSQYRDQKIDFKPVDVKPEDTDATVKTSVIQSGGSVIPIDYSMNKTPDGWKVYDIKVDGVSLVTNYRSSFSEEIKKGGVDGLIKSLDQRRAASDAK